MSTNDSKVVKNNSKAYGYNYTSLADIANAGFEIPKMRVRPTDTGEFIEYFDGKDWQTGAKIVVPEMKGSNEAQRYGSALTYARRYTALMALQLVCSDDDNVETHSEAERQYNNRASNTKKNGIDFDGIRETLEALDDEQSINDYAKEIRAKYTNLTEKQAYVIQTLFINRREDLKK